MADTPPVVRSRLRSVGPLARESASTVVHFLRAQAVIAAILTAFHLLAFYLAELPLWWASGLLVGALTLIPVLGFFVGAIAGALITVLSGGDHWSVVRMLAVMAFAQGLETFYLTPKILGVRLRMHPALVFLVVLVGAIFFGPLGAFLAAPIPAIGLLVWRYGKA
jgi:predicted PurR-regulated permease PerM